MYLQHTNVQFVHDSTLTVKTTGCNYRNHTMLESINFLNNECRLSTTGWNFCNTHWWRTSFLKSSGWWPCRCSESTCCSTWYSWLHSTCLLPSVYLDLDQIHVRYQRPYSSNRPLLCCNCLHVAGYLSSILLLVAYNYTLHEKRSHPVENSKRTYCIFLCYMKSPSKFFIFITCRPNKWRCLQRSVTKLFHDMDVLCCAYTIHSGY